MEILDIKKKYMHLLQKERDVNEKLKEETELTRLEFKDLKKKTRDSETVIKKYQSEAINLKEIIQNLEKEIFRLKKETDRRDKIIQEKVQEFVNSSGFRYMYYIKLSLSSIDEKIVAQNLCSVQDSLLQDLKKKNQELGKFRFVLDYKISELKKELEPKDKDMKTLQEWVKEVSALVHM